MNHNEELGKIVLRFIDVMMDYDSAHEADKILQSFIKECKPVLDDRMDQQWLKKYGYTYSEYRAKVNDYE